MTPVEIGYTIETFTIDIEGNSVLYLFIGLLETSLGINNGLRLIRKMEYSLPLLVRYKQSQKVFNDQIK